ncbi:MAG: glycosyltransferase [Opitutaceae bacterium]
MSRAIFCLNGPDAVNGPNIWLTRHLPLLAARGIEPVVLYLSTEPDRPCRYRETLERAGVRSHPVCLGRSIDDNTVAISRSAAELHPDFFVPNYSVAGYYAARFLRECGVVTIGMLHSDDPYYHDIIDFFLAGDPRWRLTAVVGVSEFLQTAVRERVGDACPYLHAPYGAPVPTQRARWSAERFGLVYSGRLVERQKRVSRVATAMLAAAAACPRVEGVLYGEGPEAERLTRNCAAGARRVRLGGLLRPEEIQPAMLDEQAFVLLSDFEGLSIALMEAMACGLVPIVTPMRSGVTDLVRDGETGLVVPADAPASFAEAVARLANDRASWQRLADGARAEIIKRGYTPEGCADAWVRFLDELALRPRRRGSLHIPPSEDWQMPPRSERQDGIRTEDRRGAQIRIHAALAAGRPVYLWGASRAGEVFLGSLGGRNLAIHGFIDSDRAKTGRVFHGFPIWSPEVLRQKTRDEKTPFVVITSQFEAEIGAALRSFGYVEDTDFVAG